MPSRDVPDRNAVLTIRIGVKGPAQKARAATNPKTAPRVAGATIAVHIAAVQATWWMVGWSVNMLQTSTRSTHR
jgi:hypothetical protein